MVEFKKILLPVDLTGVSRFIAPYVADLAAKYQAEVHVVNVVRGYSHITSMDWLPPSTPVFEAEALEGAEKALKKFVEEVLPTLKAAVTIVILGDPVDQLLDYITANHIDLVVMGTHGRQGLDRLIFGSVAEKMVKYSPVPVMTINPHRHI